MFSARLTFSDLQSPLDLVDGGIFLGGSKIVPFAHRLLRTAVYESDERIAVACLERLADDEAGPLIERGLDDDAVRTRLDAVVAHPLDFATIVIDRRARTVAYRASPVISAPVYLIADDRGVGLDWDYRRLFAGRVIEPDWPLALAQIAGVPTYGPRTLARDIWRATADATLVASASGVTVTLPEAIAADGPRALAEGADVEAALVETVEAIVGARPLIRARTAVELSGGMDSGLTAIAVARTLGRGVMSVGAQFGGAMGAAQRARRELLRETGGFDDLSIPAERFAPFAPGSARRERYGIWPEDENYPEMFEAIFAMLRASGIEALVSGFGGDELYPMYEGESASAPDDGPVACPFLTPAGAAAAREAATDYPRAWLQETCWLSAASQSQRMLRQGLWPVMPYLNPALARFTARLPLRYRQDRRLMRTVLTGLTGDTVFASDYVKERFDPVARRGIAENRDYLIDLVERSVIARHPDVDDAAMLAALRGDIGALDKQTYNALFRALKLMCFFQ